MKRGRTNGGDAKGKATKKFKKGYDRVGGNFGRYSGANAELKFIDLDIDDSSISASGTVFNSVNLIPQGTTESERIGRKCTIKKIGWRFRVHLPAGTIQTGLNTARIIMFLDKQCNGATAAVLNILETADFQSFRNLTETGRFRILMDRTYDMNYSAGMGNGTSNDTVGIACSDTLYKDVNIPLEFSSTTGAITEIRSNNIGILTISSLGVCALESKVRIRFSDG